ncbi:hypothetical protein DL766_003932 [Monosporascus sp. MC13-8B]|uniref:Nephrocystin 3-like N-terminal domain-containing protein n=1 Tax=Monosporascus cannonballus TaxID=155416 RepID=A0ABY0HKP7_9PEZI|nr:hypothetical protein DL762_000998 [Monosporascus cannonballus]RYP32516.1 hypothetical protein DL766_003932 [Monosporascus sp. MC13-8B]
MAPFSASLKHKGKEGRRLRDRISWWRSKPSSDDTTEVPASSHDGLDVTTSPGIQLDPGATDTTASSPFQDELSNDAPDNDIWSAAYSEAVQEFNEEIERLAVTGNKLEDLLQSLRESSDKRSDSLFSRGLRRLKQPLENVRLALDLTSPLAGLDPTLAVTTSTTAVKIVAIGICGAEERLQSHIADMLENVTVIDECDNITQDMAKEGHIHQLLDQHKSLKVEFEKWYNEAERSESSDPTQSAQDLGDFFSTRVQSLRRPLYIVIDGFDECDSENRTELVRFLNELSRKTEELKVLLSSRGYEEAIKSQLDEMVTIFLDPDQERDGIIARHLVQRHPTEIPQTVKESVISYLTEKAHGSAIWMRLTVDYIRRRKITKLPKMKTFLETLPLPKDLAKLYGTLFAHMTGGYSDTEQLVTRGLEILAVARRPLSLLELGWAVALSDPETSPATIEELAESVDEIQIFNLLQPLLGQVDVKDPKKYQLRLVHQSLRELILQSEPRKWSHIDRDNGKRPELAREQRQKDLEAVLLRLSVQYLSSEEFKHTDLFSSEQKAVQVLEELPGIGVLDEEETDPQVDRTDGSTEPATFDPSDRGFGELYAYSACFWLDHFNGASSGSLATLPDIVNLCRAGSRTLSNWVTMYCRPDCTITAKLTLDPQYLDPLVVVSEFGPRVAMDQLLVDYERYTESMAKYSNWTTVDQLDLLGDATRLGAIFLHPIIGPEIRTIHHLEKAMISWTQPRGDREKWEELFSRILPTFMRERSSNDLLRAACRSGCLPVVKMLFEEAARNPALKVDLLRDNQPPADRQGKIQLHLGPHQSVGEAAAHGHLSVVRYLLEQDGIEAHIRYRDARGFNVFHRLAARSCRPEMFELLIPRFREGVDEVNVDNDTPLDLVVFGEDVPFLRAKSAEILLRLGGANVRGGYKGENTEWDEPLRRAARTGQARMCRVLVEHGGEDPRRVLRNDGSRGLIDPFVEILTEEVKIQTLDTLYSLAETYRLRK